MSRLFFSEVLFCFLLFVPGSSPICAQVLQPNPMSISFGPAVNYGAGAGPRHIFCADLDGDSSRDMVVANANAGTVSVLKNNGDGTFQGKIDFAAGAGPQCVFCSDLDGDGDLDLAVANNDSPYVSILKNNGDGTFQDRVGYAVEVFPFMYFVRIWTEMMTWILP